MTETAIKLIDHIRHEQIHPFQQSIRAHIELAKNEALHISPTVLKDFSKRLQQIENNILLMVNKGD